MNVSILNTNPVMQQWPGERGLVRPRLPSANVASVVTLFEPASPLCEFMGASMFICVFYSFLCQLSSIDAAHFLSFSIVICCGWLSQISRLVKICLKSE